MIKLKNFRRQLSGNMLFYFLHQQYNLIPLVEQPVPGLVANTNIWTKMNLDPWIYNFDLKRIKDLQDEAANA